MIRLVFSADSSVLNDLDGSLRQWRTDFHEKVELWRDGTDLVLDLVDQDPQSILDELIELNIVDPTLVDTTIHQE